MGLIINVGSVYITQTGADPVSPVTHGCCHQSLFQPPFSGTLGLFLVLGHRWLPPSCPGPQLLQRHMLFPTLCLSFPT